MDSHRRVGAAVRGMIGLVALATCGILIACSESAAPTAASSLAPSDALSASIAKASATSSTVPGSFLAQGLLREKPLTAPVTVTKTIPSGGGSIDVPGTDFQLQIPRGAFNGTSMTFTVTALAGSVVAYNFEPHGAVFNVPLKFVQHLSHTNLKGVKPAPGFMDHLDGAYFPDASLIDPVTGIAVVTEIMPADVDYEWSGDQLTFPIHHFSGYLISTGRR